DIVHLEFGEPDFEAPAVIADAVMRAIKDGRTKYTSSLGIPALREAVADHYAARYGVRISPDQVLVTPGTSPAMLLLFGLLLDPAPEIRARQKVFGNFFSSTNEVVQWAGVAALREAGGESARFRAIFAERRRAMVEGLRRVGLGVGFEPTGAFYVLANARAYTSDSERFARELSD